MQGFCVLHAAGNRVGQVDLIPLAVQVYLVPSVVAGAGITLGQCARMPWLRHIAANSEEKS